MCGGNRDTNKNRGVAKGLSPRVRGKLERRMKRFTVLRSIPACARETSFFGKKAEKRTVYPRVCGGNVIFLLDSDCFSGLSPRVRGKLVYVDGDEWRFRSIPACAGETIDR